MTSLIFDHEHPSVFQAIREVETAAFQRPDEADIVEAVRNSNTPSISLVASLEGRVVAHVLFSEVTAAGLTAGALGPVAVWPDRQNDGIGSALINHSMAFALDRWPVLFVLGEPDYYGRFGFRAAESLGYYFDSFRPAFQVTWRDRPMNPPGGRVLYHPAFGA